MIPATVLERFSAELARRHRNRAIDERTVRSTIAAYARCYAIVNGLPAEIAPSQIEQAVTGYRHQRRQFSAQLALLPLAG